MEIDLLKKKLHPLFKEHKIEKQYSLARMHEMKHRAKAI